MNRTIGGMVIAMVFAAGPLHAQTAGEPPPTPAQEQPEVLTRGPMHEAFAEPVNLQVQEGLMAPIQPPADIVENPPAERPAGRQFIWVPGYWAWDAERNTYIWVSGCWRAAPPKQYWVPGYWSRTDGRWEWVAGFWAPVANVKQMEYLPPPPAIADPGPPGPPPSADNIWVPPCWYWVQARYVWRPGYWITAQADWVWVPSHYVWAPRGYVFVAGHWDYALARRGVLFAPVYFPRPFNIYAGFSFALNVVVDLGILQFNLFTYPRYCHYYFGDYFDNSYIRVGIFPWFECERRHTWYDPVYEHDRWRYRRVEPGWEDHVRREYDLRRADRDLRPPRTYRELEARQASLPESRRRSIQLAQPLTRYVAEQRTTLRFEPIKTDARQKLSSQAAEVRKFGEERSRWESASRASGSTRPASERQPSLTPTPSTREWESMPPSARGRESVTTPTREQESVGPSTQGRGPASMPGREQPPGTPSGRERERATPPDLYRTEGVPPLERREPETRSYERRPPDRSPYDSPGAEASSWDRGPAFVPPRDVNVTSPERVNIPVPPIADNQRGLGIFRKGPPSRPADEQRTDFGNTRGASGGSRDDGRPEAGESTRGGGASRDRR